jgi:predicted nuclease of predicted toxin-antitoxin system
MKFLLDVNVAGSVSTYLKESGHDIVEVRTTDPRMPDSAILELALKENRIIVTTDKDFEEMIWHQRKKHCGVLRLENLPRAKRLELLEDTIDQFSEELESGSIVIATQKKYRVRNPFWDLRST